MVKNLKFISGNSAQKDFTTELRRNVAAYFKEKGISTKGDYRMWLKTFVLVSLYLVPFVLILTVNMNVWIAFILVILMGIGEAGVGMSVMHDAAHGSYSKKQWVNDLMAGTMILLGSNTCNWKIQHNYLHHTYTNIYGYDPDIETKAVIRLNKFALLRKYHRFQYIYAYPFYGLMTLSKLLTDISQLIDYNKQGLIQEKKVSLKTELIKLIAIKLIYFSILLGLPFLFSSFSWWQILIGFATMHVIAGGILGTIFQMAHVVEGVDQPIPDNNGIIKNEWMVHELNTACDFGRNNKILSWYIGGLNYQIEHHLFSNICHLHYPALASIVEQTSKKYGFTYLYQPTFASAFSSHVRRLKELGNPEINKSTSTD